MLTYSWKQVSQSDIFQIIYIYISYSIIASGHHMPWVRAPEKFARLSASVLSKYIRIQSRVQTKGVVCGTGQLDRSGFTNQSVTMCELRIHVDFSHHTTSTVLLLT